MRVKLEFLLKNAQKFPKIHQRRCQKWRQNTKFYFEMQEKSSYRVNLPSEIPIYRYE